MFVVSLSVSLSLSVLVAKLRRACGSGVARAKNGARSESPKTHRLLSMNPIKSARSLAHCVAASLRLPSFSCVCFGSIQVAGGKLLRSELVARGKTNERVDERLAAKCRLILLRRRRRRCRRRCGRCWSCWSRLRANTNERYCAMAAVGEQRAGGDEEEEGEEEEANELDHQLSAPSRVRALDSEL